ncbi:predicted protein [Naegleria gruberi]|uniref:Predicted protein n=1 Tax=Naegleria gruberi TaxID=5762 RepID=D2VNE9_NAEGR|nr:uncharacterized protein NAEGRDRAFT_70473 [Naegleria gruberi]EFC41647.1 predicted protein [Naegleria gruberi]|eukprot:XP_002674391.1 predicted protein [Naegleria gruberi strain NEG-M]
MSQQQTGTKGSTSFRAFSLFKNFAEYFIDVPKESHFYERGVLTPEEFEKAGDLLVSKCPTWSWSAGEPSKRKDYLPADKQFLITRNVPCLKRCSELIEMAKDEEPVEDGEWIATHINHTKEKEKEEIGDITGGVDDLVIHSAEDDEEDDGEAIDIDNYSDSELEDTIKDKGALEANNGDSILQTRTYDFSITYDKYYQTPRVWLFGYDERGAKLESEKILEDIHADYGNKTVTIEQHPHLNTQWASIHPCRHAEVMKKMVDRLVGGGSGEKQFVRVDLYLFLFLKFISSVIPTIEYDFTTQVD